MGVIEDRNTKKQRELVKEQDRFVETIGVNQDSNCGVNLL